MMTLEHLDLPLSLVYSMPPPVLPPPLPGLYEKRIFKKVMNTSQSRKRRAKRRGLLSSSELKLHLTKFFFFHSAHYLGYFLRPVHKLKFLMGVCTLQVGGEALGASTHLRDASELLGFGGLRLCDC